jgi:hypothetical protein
VDEERRSPALNSVESAVVLGHLFDDDVRYVWIVFLFALCGACAWPLLALYFDFEFPSALERENIL